MELRSTIGYLNDNEEYVYSYCHFDGDKKNLGKDLITNFNSESKARNLVNGGDMMSPKESCYSLGESWDDIKPMIAIVKKQAHTQVWSYIWEDGKWFYSENGKVYNELEGNI